MKFIIKCTLAFFLLCLFILLPFGQGVSAPQSRYVIRAQVSLYQGQRQQTKIYLQPQKINSLLNFLRMTDPRGNIRTAQSIPDSHHYRIALLYSDGSENVYHLQDYRYFCKNSGVWQKISTSHAQLLYPLLQLLPPDQ